MVFLICAGPEGLAQIKCRTLHFYDAINNIDTESYEIDRKTNDIFNSINNSQYKKLWEGNNYRDSE